MYVRVANANIPHIFLLWMSRASNRNRTISSREYNQSVDLFACSCSVDTSWAWDFASIAEAEAKGLCFACAVWEGEGKILVKVKSGENLQLQSAAAAVLVWYRVGWQQKQEVVQFERAPMSPSLTKTKSNWPFHSSPLPSLTLKTHYGYVFVSDCMRMGTWEGLTAKLVPMKNSILFFFAEWLKMTSLCSLEPCEARTAVIVLPRIDMRLFPQIYE